MHRIYMVFIFFIQFINAPQAAEKVVINNKLVTDKYFGHLLKKQDNIKVTSEFKIGVHKLANRIKRKRDSACVVFLGNKTSDNTMAARLLGQEVRMDVFKVDLSAVVSKYIGETEKNINRVFKQAERKKMMLLFDEADALFGKRSEIKGANDRYANIEISYILQKLKTHAGIIIVSSNQRKMLDPSVNRRCKYELKIQQPKKKKRL